MSPSKIVNPTDLCRFCLEKTENIHLTKEIDPNIIDILNFSLNFKVTETFTSLINLCPKCKETIDGFSTLIQTARDTQDSLEKMCKNEQFFPSDFDGSPSDNRAAEPARKPADFTYDNVMLSIKRAESVGPRNLKCFGCGFVGINLKALISHVSVAHRDFKGRWCPKCNGLFDDLKAHGRTHDAGDLTCRFCFKSFTITKYLVRHLLSHMEAKRENKRSERVRGSTRTRTKEGAGGNFKLCNVCGKQFSNGSKLLTHLRSHTNEAPFSCVICNKRLKTSSHLRQHENVHRELRPYQCGTCNKSFNQSSTLRTHSKLHGDKDHRCSMCEKAFCRLSDLKVHLRTHTGEKPFRCRVCDAAFIQRSHLTEHEKKHLDIRPYKCVYCDKSFTQKSTLKSHIDIHLGVKSYQCNYCPYAARQSYVLKTHMKQHEKDFVNEEEI